ncbi:CCDC90 family protein [Methylosinus sp. Sm6]|uniref:CCDC90 family protein n=1 Tax=Methylosinus sp. Sm6 TaxID=2866948 RepID=UPI001C9933F3|nr:CCDC90 family protein [Methylosinus sp. Sm6]MBY6241134.1 CCDC90 family protein [Methylosinus sp. Sm6]
MSAAVAFDTLKFVRKLEAGGFTQAQAMAAAEAFADATSQELATKADLAAVKAEMKADLRDVEVRLEAKIETTAAYLKVDILRWLVVTQVALGGFIFAAFKFVK